MLSVVPLATTGTDFYRSFVIAPTLPPEVRDVGTRAEPNVEFLMELAPEIVFYSPEYGPLSASLSARLNTQAVPIYVPGRPDHFQGALAATGTMGERLGRTELARRRIAESRRRSARHGRCAALRRNPLGLPRELPEQPACAALYPRQPVRRRARRSGHRERGAAECQPMGFCRCRHGRARRHSGRSLRTCRTAAAAGRDQPGVERAAFRAGAPAGGGSHHLDVRWAALGHPLCDPL